MKRLTIGAAVWICFLATPGLWAATSAGTSGTFGLPSGCLSSNRPVVVLVRGLKSVLNLAVPQELDNSIYWTEIEPQLWNDFEVWRCDTVNSLGGHEQNANAIGQFIKSKISARGSEPAEIAIVAHSIGGLMARAYVAGDYPYNRLVTKVITLGTPHCGSRIADDINGILSRKLPVWAKIVIDMLWPAPAQLTEGFVQKNFNPRVQNKRNARFYFLGGNGGSASSSFVYVAGDMLLRFRPPGRFYNLSDGTVTLRSAHGQYQDGLWTGYAEKKQVWASTSPHGHEYLYQYVVDHTQIKNGEGGVLDTLKAILWNRAPEPGAPVYSSPVRLADAGAAPWQAVGDAGGLLKTADLFTHSFPVEGAEAAAFSCRTPNGDARLTLIAPGGARIEATTLDPSVTFSEHWDEFGRLKTFEVTNPAPGQWTLEVYGQAMDPVGEPYNVDTRVKSQLALLPETPYVQATATPAVIGARLDSNAAGIPGQAVTAFVADQFGSGSELVLYDDGAHSDGAAGDGVYASTRAITTPGFYSASFTATGTTGGNPFQRTAGASLQVANATATLGAILSDQPVNIGGGAGFDTLRVAVPLNVVSGSKFTVSAALKSGGVEVTRAVAARTDCVTGSNTFNLDFSGAELREKSIAGPYTLSDITIFDDLTDPPLIVQESAGGYVTTTSNPLAFNDGTPPNQIVDLAVTGRAPSSVKLAWSSPADDTGVTAYEMRYGSDPVSLTTWGTSTPVPGLPTPKSKNQPQEFTVTGLSAGIYYFALRSSDAAGNWSEVSNSPSATLSPLQADTAPGSNVEIEGVVTDVAKTHADRFCIQSEGAPWGVWVDLPAATSVSAGDKGVASGILSVEDGERRLSSSSFGKAGIGAVRPRSMLNRAVGGGPVGSLPGVNGGYGPNNSGALVLTVGRVTYVDSAAHRFTMTDGSGRQGALIDGDGHVGLRVQAPPEVPLPSFGSFVIVRGLSGSYASGGTLYPVVRLRGPEDVSDP